MTYHPADEWFARTFTGAPTDQREIIRAAYDAGKASERARALAYCARVEACWLNPVALSAVRHIRQEISRGE